MKAHPKVIHVAPIKQVAGAERHLLHLLPGLRDKDIDAQMLILGDAHPPETFTHTLAAHNIPYTLIKMPLAGSALSAITFSNIMTLQAHFRKTRPDIIHTHLYHGDLYGIPAARLAGVGRVVSTRHAIESYRTKRLWRLLGRGAAHILTISEAATQITQAQERIPPHKITMIYHGVPIPPHSAVLDLRGQLGLSGESILMGTVARLEAVKGVDLAIAAFRQLHGRYPDLHYIIVGEGEERPALQAQVQAAGLAGRVHFMGWRDDKDALLAAFDVFLLSSHSEGFGIALLEAMAHKLPIVCTDVGATSEIVIEGETGYLVPPDDPDAIAGALIKLLDDPDQARAMGAAGRHRLESVFSLEKMIDQTASVYQHLLQK